jgi:membrane-associated protease RseP (regulator of RpoE activity)
VKLQHLSGPVGIGRIYYLLFQNERGWQLALWFSVILNVNLAILNMLPIPVLDGGHIVLAIIESVRRKPVNMRVLEVIQTSCAMLIIDLCSTSFFVCRIFRSLRIDSTNLSLPELPRRRSDNRCCKLLSPSL